MLAIDEKICIGSLLTVDELDVVVVVVVVVGTKMSTLEEDEVLFISSQLPCFFLRQIGRAHV